MSLDYFFETLSDLRNCINRFSLVLILGWQDIKQRYRRSKIGPFWLTISMAIMIAMIGLIFGQVMNAQNNEYLLHLATGIIFWTFISTTVQEGAKSFIDGAGMIRQLNLPLTMYPLRVIWRNAIILFHNLLILPLVFLIVPKGLGINMLWLIPGFALLVANIFWISLFLGVFCTRFRDLPQIVASLMQVLFYLTPIIWMPDAISSSRRILILNPNPSYHLLELVRAPLMGNPPTYMNLTVGFVMLLIGGFVGFCIFGKYKKRIAYWL